MTTQATPLAELIPDDLHMTTAERLRLVARILREHPDRHVQEVWVEDRSQSSYDWGAPSVAEVAGDGRLMAAHCGTVACVAGWAVACSPAEEVDDSLTWSDAGARALGLTPEAATRLFHGYNDHATVIEVLDHLASIDRIRSIDDLAAWDQGDGLPLAASKH